MGNTNKDTKSIESRHKKILKFIFVFFVIYMAYSSLMNPTATSDHMPGYGFYRTNGVELPNFSLQSIINAITGGNVVFLFLRYLWWFLGLFHISLYENQFVIDFIMYIILTQSVCVMSELFEEYFDNLPSQIVMTGICLISIVNPYFIETFTYTAMDTCVGILFACYGAKFFKKRRYIWAAVFVLLAVNLYRIYECNFWMMAFAFIYLRYKDNFDKETVKQYVYALLVGGIPAAINIALSRIFSMLSLYLENLGTGIMASSDPKTITSATEVIDTLDNGSSFDFLYLIASKVYHTLGIYWYMTVDAFGYYPMGLVFATIVAAFLITVYYIHKSYGIKNILHYCILFAMENTVPLLLYFFIGYSLVARIAWIVFINIAMIFMVMWCYVSEGQAGKPVLYSRGITAAKLSCLVLIVFFIFHIYSTQTKVADQLISNRVDEQILDCIQAEIERYESEKGIEITEIACRLTPDAQYQSPYLNLQSDTSAHDRKIMFDAWSNVEALNYFEDEYYEEVEMTDEEYDKYFGGKSWDTYVPEEQLVFIDNRLYWAIY